MPGGDRTGPMGRGPMTGWGLGTCGGAARPGLGRGGGWGRDFGGGGGWGRGWRHRYWATGQPGWARAQAWGVPTPPWHGAVDPPAEVEKQMLEEQTANLEAELAWMRSRLEELEGRPSENE